MAAPTTTPRVAVEAAPEGADIPCMSESTRARALLRPLPRFLWRALLLGSSPIAGGLGAQSASSLLTAPPLAETVLARADSLYAAADLDASFAVAEARAAVDPSDGAVGWRAARAAGGARAASGGGGGAERVVPSW